MRKNMRWSIGFIFSIIIYIVPKLSINSLMIQVAEIGSFHYSPENKIFSFYL
uniref:Uncharacterized protein n=1 Tax=Octopus bimaculoides TaxID=37653 RepID=A0A0L8I0V3_OCTBM